MITHLLRPALLSLALVLFVCTPEASPTRAHQEGSSPDEQDAAQASKEEMSMNVHYLEIVTPDADATCDMLEKLHGVSFGKPDAGLGNARTAALDGGWRIGVRAPMHESESPVVRPYILVDDIEAAVEAAKASGGEIALPSTEIPGHGTFAIYFQGGIQHGLWQR